MLALSEESWVKAGHAWRARPQVHLTPREADRTLFDRQHRQKAGWREDRDPYELSQVQQVSIPGHDEIGVPGLGGFEDSVIVGIPGDNERLGGGDDDGGGTKVL